MRSDVFLASVIDPDPRLVSLSTGGLAIDIDRLSGALDEDEAEAISLGAAPLLAEIDETTPAFEEWLRTARSALGARLEACAERVLRTPHAHDVATLASAAERLAEVEPDARRLALDAFARIRRPDLARLHGMPQASVVAPSAPIQTVEPLRLGFRRIGTDSLPGLDLPLRAFVEDCADHLASYRSFIVMAPHSTLRENGVGTDLDLVGRLAPGQDGPMLALRLEDAQGKILWAGRFRAGPGDLVDSGTRLVRRIAGQVADAVEARIAEHARIEGQPEAYAAYLAGRDAARVLSLPNLRRARRAYVEAGRADPAMAAAPARIAETLYIEWVLRGGTDPELLEVAARQAERARRTDPGAAVGHWVSGAVALYRRETDRVEGHYADAETLAPNCADLMLEHADALSHLEKPGPARTLFARALDLNPLPPDRYWWIGASIAFGDRDFEAAADYCTRIESQETALALRAASFAMAGHLDEAQRWTRLAREALPDASVDDLAGLAPNPPGGRKDSDYRAGLALAGFT